MTPIKILLLEDDEADYILTRSLVGRLSGQFTLTWAPTYETAIEMLAGGGFDVCLVDYRLDAHEGLELLREPGLDRLPIIVLTGQDDPGIAALAMKAGAADYLVKGEFNASMFERSMRHAIERKRAHDELIRARDQLDRQVFEQTAELREANASLLRREAELREASGRKDEFLAMLAHELRNPMAAIKNALTLAMRSRDAEYRGRSLDILDRQIPHLGRLIDDLLDVSRITSGKIRLDRGLVDASEILDQAVEAVRPMIEGRGHTLEIAVDRGNLWLDADPTRIEQVVQNLLSNAAKYSEEGGHLKLSAAKESGKIVIRVRDDGIGLEPAQMAEIFGIFAQVDRSLARSQGGLGLGLAVAKRLVEMHDGSISVWSEGAGKGSEFTIRIPAAEPPDRAAPHREPSSPSKARAAKILLVDDNVDMIRAMARLLELQGHVVKTAINGPEGLKSAVASQPEFILLDIGLPGLNGYEVAARIRRENLVPGVVLIAISGYGQAEDRRRSLEAGFDMHLVKPVDYDRLLAILARDQGSKDS